MAPIGYFFKAVAVVLSNVLLLYQFIIVARAVLSWVNPDPYNPIVRFIHNITEPVLAPIRRRLPTSLGPIDFSPIIVFFAVYLLRLWIVPTLESFGTMFLG
jgi:YggT family protein